ncbi:hypothetical protein PanWU01x14_273710, partial [Parasponia andersonii]
KYIKRRLIPLSAKNQPLFQNEAKIDSCIFQHQTEKKVERIFKISWKIEASNNPPSI